MKHLTVVKKAVGLVLGFVLLLGLAVPVEADPWLGVIRIGEAAPQLVNEITISLPGMPCTLVALTNVYNLMSATYDFTFSGVATVSVNRPFTVVYDCSHRRDAEDWWLRVTDSYGAGETAVLDPAKSMEKIFSVRLTGVDDSEYPALAIEYDIWGYPTIESIAARVARYGVHMYFFPHCEIHGSAWQYYFPGYGYRLIGGLGTMMLPLDTLVPGADAPPTPQPTPTPPARPAGQLGVTINGIEQTFNPPPMEIGGSMMLPFRAIGEALGMTVSSSSGVVTLTAPGVNATHAVRTNVITVNGVDHTFAAPSTAVEGRLLMPLRMFGAIPGITVRWDSPTRTAVVTTE